MLEIWNVLKEQVSTQFFRKVNIIKGNIIEDVKRIFDVFAVDNLDDFFGLKAKEMELPYYYRKSEKVTTNPVDIYLGNTIVIIFPKRRVNVGKL